MKRQNTVAPPLSYTTRPSSSDDYDNADKAVNSSVSIVKSTAYNNIIAKKSQKTEAISVDSVDVWPKFTSLEPYLRSFFYWYGGFVYAHRWALVIIPVLLTPLFATGFIWFEELRIDDPAYVFTPKDARWKRELSTFSRLWPLDENKFQPGKSFETRRFINVLCRAADGGSVLRPEILAELQLFNEFIMHNISVPTENGRFNLSYQDLCLSYDWVCGANEHIAMFREMEQVGRVIDLSFPKGGNRDTPVYLGTVLGDITLNRSTNHVTEAGITQLFYFLKQEPESVQRYSTDFEYAVERFILHGFESRLVTLSFAHYQSLQDGLDENAQRFVPNFVISFITLAFYCIACAFMLRRQAVGSVGPAIDWVRSRPYLACAGLFNTLISLISAFGLMLLIGVPYNVVNTIIPFLIIAIGIDDMFIMTACYDQVDRGLPVRLRIAETMRSSGVAVSITNITDILSFLIGCLTDLPGVELFCVYAFVCVLVCYIYQLTFFAGFMTIMSEVERQKRHCIFLYKMEASKESGTEDTIAKKRKIVTESRNQLPPVYCMPLPPPPPFSAAMENANKYHNPDGISVVPILNEFKKDYERRRHITTMLEDGESERIYGQFYNESIELGSVKRQPASYAPYTDCGTIERSQASLLRYSTPEKRVTTANGTMNTLDRLRQNRQSYLDGIRGKEERLYGNSNGSESKNRNENDKQNCNSYGSKYNINKNPIGGQNQDTQSDYSGNRMVHVQSILIEDCTTITGVESEERCSTCSSNSSSISNSNSSPRASKNSVLQKNRKNCGSHASEPSTNSASTDTVSTGSIDKLPKKILLTITDELRHHTNSENRTHVFFGRYYAPLLLYNGTRITVTIIYVVYLIAALIGCSQFREGLEPRHLVTSDHYIAQYFTDIKSFWRVGPQLHVAVLNAPNFTDVVERTKLLNTVAALENTEYTMGREGTIFFLLEYMNYLSQLNAEPENTDRIWHKKLRSWLKYTGGSEQWERDIVYAADGIEILAFRFQVAMKNIVEPNQHKLAARLLREIADAQPYHIEIYHEAFPFADQYLIILPSTYRNVLISLCVMTIIAFLLIPSLPSSILIVLSIISISTGVFGYMTFWGVNLDAISMISIIMSIGFAVDLSAHIVYAFVTAHGGETAAERVVGALEHLGWPIFQGATSTIAGITVLYTVDAYIILTFFKTIWLTMVLGLVHGLVFIPVMLSFIPISFFRISAKQ